jgi:hypothetical protein
MISYKTIWLKKRRSNCSALFFGIGGLDYKKPDEEKE